MSGPRDQDITEVLSKLHAQLGEELLSALLGGTMNETRGHVDEGKPSLGKVTARATYLMKLLEHLAGTYNSFGIQRWFRRKRAQLGGHSPLEHLLSTDEWTPDDDTAIEVATLALASRSMLAT